MIDTSGRRKGGGFPKPIPTPHNEFRNQEERGERTDGLTSNLDPKNQFDPAIRILPRPRLTGVSAGFRVEIGSILKRLFSKKYCEQERLKKTVREYEKRNERHGL